MFLKFHWGKDFRVSSFDDYVYGYGHNVFGFLIRNKGLQQFKLKLFFLLFHVSSYLDVFILEIFKERIFFSEIFRKI